MTKPNGVAGPHGTRGVGYLRVSDSKQEIERQRESIAAFCRQHEIQVQKLVEDQGRRRHELTTKGAFGALRAEIADRKWDWLLVDSLDRLGAADPLEYLELLAQCRRHGCQVWQASDSRELTSSEIGRIVTTTVQACGSSTELLNKSTRDLTKKNIMALSGAWTGGFIPVGLAVASLAPDGVERWRVYDRGQDQRLRVFPDGRTEVWNGKGAFPKDRRPGDRLQLVPGDEKQLEAVRLAFAWYANEEVSFYGIAGRLNRLGHRLPRGPWYGQAVMRAIQNPVYLGTPAWGKHTSARHAELVDGLPRALGLAPGAKVKQRARPRDQWVLPDAPVFEPVIDRATWDAVQQKLGGPKGRRAPANPELWLSGLVYCGTEGCQRRMVGWNRTRPGRADRPGYVCSSFRLYGKECSSGCKAHHTDHGLLVEYLDRYLAEVGAVLEGAAEDGDGLLRHLFDRKSALYAELGAIRQGMEEHLLATLDQIAEWTPTPDGRRRYRLDLAESGELVLPGAESWADLQTAYDFVVQGQRARQRVRRAELEAELHRLVTTWSELPTARSKELCTAEIRRCEHELEHLEAPDLRARLRDLQGRLVKQARAISEARREMAAGSPRRRRAAVERVVERIVVHYEDQPRCPGSKQIYRRLVAVEFIPRFEGGEARLFRLGGEAGHSDGRPPLPGSARPSGRARVRAGDSASRGRGGTGSRRRGSSGRGGGSAAR